MAGSYYGGSTLVTMRKSANDMARRKAHWAKKLAKQQEMYDRMTPSEREKFDRDNGIRRPRAN